MPDQNVTRLQQGNKDVDQLAAVIRPLPRDIAPSTEFLDKTRMRLLQLRQSPALRQSRHAA